MPIYTDNVGQYRARLMAIKAKLNDFKPDNVHSPDQRRMTPYGIGFMVGFPLFRTPALARDYSYMIEVLRKAVNNQWLYDVSDTHISLNVTIRADINGHYYEPQGDRKVYYREYLDLLRGIRFRPFSLKVVGVY